MILFHREGFLQHLVQGNLLAALGAAETQAQSTGCIKSVSIKYMRPTGLLIILHMETISQIHPTCKFMKPVSLILWIIFPQSINDKVAVFQRQSSQLHQGAEGRKTLCPHSRAAVQRMGTNEA